VENFKVNVESETSLYHAIPRDPRLSEAFERVGKIPSILLGGPVRRIRWRRVLPPTPRPAAPSRVDLLAAVMQNAFGWLAGAAPALATCRA
jgi:hypothetical protein